MGDKDIDISSISGNPYEAILASFKKFKEKEDDYEFEDNEYYDAYDVDSLVEYTLEADDILPELNVKTAFDTIEDYGVF